jgi:hypothetical protein
MQSQEEAQATLTQTRKGKEDDILKPRTAL